jgi:hypothetical protein
MMQMTKGGRKEIRRSIILIVLSAFFGIYTAEMWVYLPDWIQELLNFWRQ